MDLKEVGFKNVNLIYLGEDNVQRLSWQLYEAFGSITGMAAPCTLRVMSVIQLYNEAK
jgi:hypothetical protein